MYIIEHEYKWKDTNFNRRESTKYIIIHHIAAKNATPDEINQWHLDNGWNGFGYNFYITKDGSIYRGRPIWAEGAHCQGFNQESIGIAFEGDFNSEKMTDEQYSAGIELIHAIRKDYPGTVIRKHSDFNKTTCPGANFRNSFIVDAQTDLPAITPPPDEYDKTDVELVARIIGINTPAYWHANAQAGRTCRGDYVQEVFKLMAGYIRAQGGI